MNEKDKRIKELLQGNFEEPMPSLDFTTNTMQKISEVEEASVQQKIEYKPVISKVGWAFIGAFLLVLMFFGGSVEKESRFNLTELLPKWHIDFSLFQSPIVMISVLVILSMIVLDRLIMRFKMG